VWCALVVCVSGVCENVRVCESVVCVRGMWFGLPCMYPHFFILFLFIIILQYSKDTQIAEC